VLRERSIRELLVRVDTRRRVRLAIDSIAIGGAVFGPAVIGGLSLVASATIAALAALVSIASRWSMRKREIAHLIEASVGPHDNLIVTAAELLDRPRPVRAEIREALERQALERVRSVRIGDVIPMARPMGVAAVVLLGCMLLASVDRAASRAPMIGGAGDAATLGAGSISVRVTPPAYSARDPEVQVNPVQVTALHGSVIRITATTGVLREWTAERTEALELRPEPQGPARFLSVIVVPDAPPVVHIERPGRDVAFATGSASLEVTVDGRDDLALSALTLRYTKASGGGETMSFTEGEVPLSLERVSAREWRARATWPLEPLGLAEGDVVVYRAIARDRNPSGRPVESDTFIVEIGRTAEIAGAGFALPTEERKYAISQQMVIYKTEQLLRNRASHAGDWLDQTRGIAIEQRMVRAEVVFLSGGHVEDEVEEAAHSHELAEGRLQNEGRAEMLRAINFMSRAEAQLNDGRADEALGLERQALASLERALDRRRYFLRTLPDRARIDLSRRLAGDRTEARPSARLPNRSSSDVDQRLSALMGALADASRGTRPIDAALAARVAAVDPSSSALQQAAVAMATAVTGDAQRAAADAAMNAVTAHALRTLPAASAVYLDRDPLAGRLADAQARPRP
jgi:hypothetical protein